MRATQPGSSAWPRLLLAIALAGAMLRASRLFGSLWFDELWESHLFLGTGIRLFNAIFLESAHPPFQQLSMWAWTSLFGDSELALRAPPFLYGTASILLVHRLALYYSNVRVALIAAALLAFSPVHIWYSAESGAYAGNLFWLLLLTLAFEEVRQREGSSRWRVAYVVSAAVVAFSHYYLALYLVVISVYCALRRSRSLLRVLLINGICLAGLACFVLLKMLFIPFATSMGYLRELNFVELWILFFNWYLCGNTLWREANPFGEGPDAFLLRPWVLAFQFSFFLAFLRGVWMLLASPGPPRRQGLQLLIYLFLVPAFLIAMGLLGFSQTYIERSTVVALPFFYIVLASGFAFSSRRSAVAGAAVLFAVNLIALVQLFRLDDQWTVYKPNPDWRGAALYFSGELDRSHESAVIFVATPATTLEYYEPRIRDPIHARKVWENFNSLLRRSERILGSDNAIVEMLRRVGLPRARAEAEARSGEIEIRYAVDAESLINSIARYDTIYVLINQYWSDRSFSKKLKRVRAFAAMSSSFEFVEERNLRGIEIAKYSLVEGMENP